MSQPENIEGQCLCGAVTITVTDAHESALGACHCRMCQRWSGGLFLNFEADKIAVEGDVARYASSAFSERAFCPRCGSHLWMRDTDEDGSTYDLMPGLFDAALSWSLRSEIYVDQAMPALDLTGVHRRDTAKTYEAKHKHVPEAKT